MTELVFASGSEPQSAAKQTSSARFRLSRDY